MIKGKPQRLRHFYNLFLKTKKKFSKRDFYFKIETNKRNIEVDFKTYKAIMVNFLDVYFKELYFLNQPKYFFLGGNMVKARAIQRMHTGKPTNGINLIWFNRPDKSFFIHVAIKKVRGSTNRFPILNREIQDNNKVDLLPDFETKFKEIIKLKQY